MGLYTKTLERILLALDETEGDEQTSGRKWRFWPPFPWPPWDDEEPRVNKTARSVRLAKSVVSFEADLAKAGADLDVLLQDPIATYNPTSWSNFTQSVSQIDFNLYIGSFANRPVPEKVIVSYPPYLKSLSELLDDVSPDVLEAYFVTRVALSLADYLGMETPVWKAKRELDELLRGLKKGALPDREEVCLHHVEETLGFASGRFFVEETFGGEYYYLWICSSADLWFIKGIRDTRQPKS